MSTDSLIIQAGNNMLHNFLHGMMFDGIHYRELIRRTSALGAC